MSAYDYALPELPADFDNRRERMLTRLQSGEKMTVQYLADQLGLPFELLATSMAVYIAARDGCPVVVDCSPARTLN
jgi:hypothetical protein